MDDKKRDEDDEKVDREDDDKESAGKVRKPDRRDTAASSKRSSKVERDDDEDDEDDEPEAAKPAAPDVQRAAKPNERASAARKTPREAPRPVDPATMRTREVRTGLLLAVAGYLAFWGAWIIYTSSVGARNVNYYSHCAWLFMIAYALVTVAAFYFVRLKPAVRASVLGAKAAEAKAGSDGERPAGKEGGAEPDAKPAEASVDWNGVLLAVAVCGPVYGMYWWVAASVLKAHYPGGWWAIEGVAIIVITLASVWAMQPPSLEDERRERWPTRRVLMLITVPYLMVFGMIWLASLYPPWPS